VVYVTQRHVSRSGMMRYLSLSIIRDGRHVDITSEAAEAMDERVHWHNGYAVLKVGGCGMDMHFATVYNLARAIRPGGHNCTGEDRGPRRCPSNDHTNDYGRLAREYDAAHPDEYNAQPGYETRTAYVAARQAWIAEQPTHDRKRRHEDSGYSLTHRTV
jgi:hypothetical protein